MQIGICDDMPSLCTMLKNILLSGDYLENSDQIIEFHSGQEIIDSGRACELDLLFLDIEMPGLSGMELLRQYGHFFQHTKIVFLTSYPQYVYEAFEVNAYRFLNKPIEQKKIQELFTSLRREQELNRIITLPTYGTDISIRLVNILFVEVYNNYTYIHTLQNNYKCYMRLKEFKDLLPEPYFYQPNKSHIINMNFIRRIDKKWWVAIMCDETRISISYRRRKLFETAFMAFKASLYP